MHRALHPQTDMDRFYIPRNNGGSGMINIEHCVEMEIESLQKYLKNTNKDY